MIRAVRKRPDRICKGLTDGRPTVDPKARSGGALSSSRAPRSVAIPPPCLPLDTTLLRPGLRLAVGLSGGADSVALLRALCERSGELGLVLHAAHLHHGLRGAEADADLEFCRELAASLEMPFHEARVDTAAEALADPKSGKAAETIEEAARRLRYAWFRQLLASGQSCSRSGHRAHPRRPGRDRAGQVPARRVDRRAWQALLRKLEPGGRRILRPLLAAPGPRSRPI